MTRVRSILAPNPGPFTLEGTNTWIVGERPAVVIDPGPDEPTHLEAVAREAGEVVAILVTHRHEDHAPGARRLTTITGAPVLAFEEGDRALRDGDEAHGLRALHTPGHSSDHLCFLLEEEGAVFTGDLVLGRGTSVVDPPDGDMSLYVRSVRRIRDLEPKRLFPGHGPEVLTPIGRLEYYLSHRAEREEQVLRAISEGKRTPAEIVPGVYGAQVPPDMFPAAARSVLAHLLKLEREGKVARTGQAKEERFVPAGNQPCARCGRPAVAGSRFCRRCGLAALQEAPPPQPD